MEGSLSETSYQRVRTLLSVPTHPHPQTPILTSPSSLEMADLLGRLETGLQRAAGASERLRSQVDRIDGYMRTSRLLNLTAGHPPPHPSTMPMEAKPELPIPSAYIPPAGPSPVGPAAMGEHIMQFQLPPELLSDWPWPLDGAHSEGFPPLAFE